MNWGRHRRRFKQWRSGLSRQVLNLDTHAWAVAIGVLGLGALRFIGGEDGGFIATLTVLVLVISAALSVRTFSAPIIISLVLQRLVFVLCREQNVFAAVGELLVQLAAAVMGPMMVRLHSQRQEHLKQANLAARGAASARFDPPEKGAEAPRRRVTSSKGAFERSERTCQAMVVLLKQALNCHTVIYAWAGPDGDTMTLGAIASDAPEHISDRTFTLAGTRFAALRKTAAPLVLRCQVEGGDLPPYYRRDTKPPRTSVMMGLPVYMHGRFLGAFFLDRVEALPFYLPDNALADRARQIVAEFAEVSRDLLQANQTISHLSNLNDAASEFSRARSFEEVYRTIVTTAVSLTSFRHAILSHRIDEAGEFELVAVTDQKLSPILGKHHSPAAGLCGLSLKAMGPFPPLRSAGPDPRPAAQPFGDTVDLDLDEGEAHLMLPIIIRDRPVAFLLVAGGASPDSSQVEVLRLLGNLAGTSLVNAEANQSLERLAITDPLTELPNQRAFRNRLAEIKNRFDRRKEAFSLLFLDLDRFKQINDTYGHPIGDEILKRVAAVLAKQMRKVDLAARYGGEEFAVLLEDTDKNGARVMAERIRTAVQEMKISDLGLSAPVTVSIGIATMDNETDTIEDLIEIADAALYQAKHEGRNRCCEAA